MFRIRKAFIVLIMLEISIAAQSRLVLRHHFEKTQFIIGEQVGCVTELENISGEPIFVKEFGKYLVCDDILFTEAGVMIDQKVTWSFSFGKNVLPENQKIYGMVNITNTYGSQWGTFGLLDTGSYRLRSVYHSGFGDTASVESVFRVIEPQNSDLEAFTAFNKIMGLSKEFRDQIFDLEQQRLNLVDFIETHPQCVYTPIALSNLLSGASSEVKEQVLDRMYNKFPNYSLMFFPYVIQFIYERNRSLIGGNSAIQLIHDKLKNEFLKQYFLVTFIDAFLE